MLTLNLTDTQCKEMFSTVQLHQKRNAGDSQLTESTAEDNSILVIQYLSSKTP